MVQYELPRRAGDRCSAWSSARAIGAAQGYWVAYWRIPSFIVTLAGMLVFRGLTLALLQGQSVGPFPKSLPAAQLGLRPRPASAATGCNTTSLRARLRRRRGAGLGRRCARRAKQARYAAVEEPFAFFLLKNGVIAVAIVFIAWLLATVHAACRTC